MDTRIFVTTFLLVPMSILTLICVPQRVASASGNKTAEVQSNDKSDNEPAVTETEVPAPTGEKSQAQKEEPVKSDNAASNDQDEASVPVVQLTGQQMLADGMKKAEQALVTQYMSTNEHHELFKSLEGTWKVKVQSWAKPDTEPQESEGTNQARLIMGGRFLEQNYEGAANGQPFEGRGLLGYDNLKGEYVTVWFDNMATGIMIGTGQYNPDTNILVTEGRMSCPITQQPRRWFRDVLTFIDADNYKYETYMKDQWGIEYRSMAITYTKVP